jgi:hypothetical protein
MTGRRLIRDLDSSGRNFSIDHVTAPPTSARGLTGAEEQINAVGKYYGMWQ